MSSGAGKRATHQLIDVMFSMSTPGRPRSRPDSSCLQQKGARRVSLGRLAMQQRPSHEHKGSTEAAAKGLASLSSRRSGQDHRRGRKQPRLQTWQHTWHIAVPKRSSFFRAPYDQDVGRQRESRRSIPLGQAGRVTRKNAPFGTISMITEKSR